MISQRLWLLAALIVLSFCPQCSGLHRGVRFGIKVLRGNRVKNLAASTLDGGSGKSGKQQKPDLSDGSDDSSMYGLGGVGSDSDSWEEQARSGFDWELEKMRRFYEGPSFAPMRMNFWQPLDIARRQPPGTAERMSILFRNGLQMMGLLPSQDGAPLVQGVNTYKGSMISLLQGVVKGDLQTLQGGPLFLLLWNYYQKYGPVFKLAFGPKSFIVVSDPTMVKHILTKNPGNYDKGILADILEPVMGKGLIPADPETWKVRRKAIVPGFHKAWLNGMMNLFYKCNVPFLEKLESYAEAGKEIEMETEFCSVSLDIIGKAVFNYDFGSVTQESPVIKAVYRALQETEKRSMSFIPYWKLPYAEAYIPSLKDFRHNMDMLNDVLNNLISTALKTQNLVDEKELQKKDYADMENPSLLRFLVDMRGEESSSRQLRDDLMTMLIAGHETTAALLTWTVFELSQQPDLLKRLQNEVDTVLDGSVPRYEDVQNMPLMRHCFAETLRMYPEPPLLIRRALEDDMLPRGGAEAETFIPRGSDIFIATWNLHRSPEFWEHPNKYDPDRFNRPHTNANQHEWKGYKPGATRLYPDEVQSDFAFIPFGGGGRKCLGDQFAMMESVMTMALLLQRYDFTLNKPAADVGMRTGATIHTATGLHMKLSRRTNAPEPANKAPPVKSMASDTLAHSAPGPKSGCPFPHL